MLDKLKNALATTSIPFKHVAWATAPSGTYGTFCEDGSDSLYADDTVYQQFVEGTVDVYTKDDSGAPVEEVQSALTAAGISWSFDLADFDDDTGLLHYQWGFEVVGYGA